MVRALGEHHVGEQPVRLHFTYQRSTPPNRVQKESDVRAPVTVTTARIGAVEGTWDAPCREGDVIFSALSRWAFFRCRSAMARRAALNIVSVPAGRHLTMT